MIVYALGDIEPTITDKSRVWISPGAYVIGNVTLGLDVSAWFGVTIRGDTERLTIRDGTCVQDNAVLHADAGFPLDIGKNVTIGHAAILHGCSIGDNCIVGMGATILNGARVGANSIVGANALITEEKEFPANSLIVGSPAKAIRTLTGDEIRAIGKSAEDYVWNSRVFSENLRPVEV